VLLSTSMRMMTQFSSRWQKANERQSWGISYPNVEGGKFFRLQSFPDPGRLAISPE
jgi:hypothetical protein